MCAVLSQDRRKNVALSTFTQQVQDRTKLALCHAGAGLGAFAILAATYGLFWAYTHPERDLWGVPVLSKSNNVNSLVTWLFALVLVPAGMLTANAIFGYILQSGLARWVLSSILAVPVAFGIAMILNTPELAILIAPILMLSLMVLRRGAVLVSAAYAAGGAIIAIVVLRLAPDYSGISLALVLAFVGWGVFPMLPALARRKESTEPPLPVRASIVAAAIGYGCSIGILVISLGIAEIYFKPFRLTLFEITHTGIVVGQGPVQQISGPEDRTIDRGSATAVFEITGEGPATFCYIMERKGSGNSIIGGDAEKGFAAWELSEPPGTLISVTYEPNMQLRRIRLLIDRDGDGIPEERRRADSYERWAGFRVDCPEPSASM